MICVYPADCTDFSGNGLGVVTPMSCTVTETLNGEWELTLVHDIDKRGKWTRLSEGCILRAPVPAAMTPSVELVTQQYQTSTYDVQIYKITTKSGPLHLRSGTGTNYRILGKYKKGREVIVLNKTTSSWYEVTAPDGKHGYMASQYLTFQRTETQTVQTNVGFRNQVIEARQLRDQPFRIEGKLTDDERQELTQAAREGATADYDYAGEINALWAAVRALQQSIAPPAKDEWPEFVQPTGAGTAYQVGDKVTFKGVRYVCRLPHCVWSPADYPIGWQKQN